MPNPPLRTSTTPTPDGRVPGIMGHGKNADFVLNLDVIDAVRKVPERSPPNGTVDLLIEAGVLLDADEHVLEIF
jgi:hypothetical protein